MNNDDFWTSLATGHTNTVLAGSMDSHLTGRSVEESFGSVRTLTDKMRAANALALPVEAGTKVVFAGGMGAYLTYEDIPADGITGEVVTVKSATGEITHHEGKVFVKWDDGKFRPIHAEHLRLGGHGKQASGYTVKVRRDGGQYWIEAKGDLVGPFTAADALGEVEKHLKNPDVVVMGRNHSLGRSGAADPYSKAPFAILDRRGDVVDEGYSLDSLWKKWFDRFLGWRMASSIQASDIKADFEKIKALAEKRPDSKFLKSILKQMADKGFAPTDKQMAVVKKIEDEIKQQGEMKKELKGLDKKAAVPRGAAQNAIMTYLYARSNPVALTSMVRDSSFRGVPFGKIMKAAEVLAKKGLIRYFSDPNEMKGYMLQRTASQYRVASLGDLTDFLKSADGKLIHKSTNDLWSYNKDADGNFLVSRLFDDESEPLKG
jgi:hypothetical protein